MLRCLHRDPAARPDASVIAGEWRAAARAIGGARRGLAGAEEDDAAALEIREITLESDGTRSLEGASDGGSSSHIASDPGTPRPLPGVQ